MLKIKILLLSFGIASASTITAASVSEVAEPQTTYARANQLFVEENPTEFQVTLIRNGVRSNISLSLDELPQDLLDKVTEMCLNPFEYATIPIDSITSISDLVGKWTELVYKRKSSAEITVSNLGGATKQLHLEASNTVGDVIDRAEGESFKNDALLLVLQGKILDRNTKIETIADQLKNLNFYTVNRLDRIAALQLACLKKIQKAIDEEIAQPNGRWRLFSKSAQYASKEYLAGIKPIVDEIIRLEDGESQEFQCQSKHKTDGRMIYERMITRDEKPVVNLTFAVSGCHSVYFTWQAAEHKKIYYSFDPSDRDQQFSIATPDRIFSCSIPTDDFHELVKLSSHIFEHGPNRTLPEGTNAAVILSPLG